MSTCKRCGAIMGERTCGDNYGQWVEEYCPNCGVYSKGSYFNLVENEPRFE